MTEEEYEPLSYYAEGGQAKEAFIEVLEALIQTIKKNQGSFYQFKIKVDEKG